MAWREVASLEEAQRARPWLAVRIGREAIAIAELDGAWYAVEGLCTHAGCAFADEASLEDGTIVCNCHGSEFDLRTGEVRRGPAEYGVRTFPVRVVDGQLEVDM